MNHEKGKDSAPSIAAPGRSDPAPESGITSSSVSLVKAETPKPPVLVGPGLGGSPPKPASAVVEKAPAHVVNQIVAREYAYARLGLLLGLACIIGGVVLGLNGVAGSTSWTASVLGLESNINDAAPGVVLFIVGVFFVWITKPKVKIGEVR